MARRSRLSILFILCAALCSGASALTLEVVWSKALVVPLGNSTDSTALVLAGFMLGMAGGAWLGARLAARLRRVLLAYAAAELALALFACWVPQLIAQLALWVPPAGLAMAPTWVFAARACLSLLLIAVPCFVMGATLPLLLAARSLAVQSRLFLGALYGINTLGAALASMAAGFYAVAHFGLTGCSKCAAALSTGAALLAVAAQWLLRDEPETAHLQHPHDRVSQRTECAIAGPDTQPLDVYMSARIAAVFAFTCGFALLSAEVFWTRILTFVFGHDTYAFATLLSVVVLGHALGGLAYTGLAKRPPGLLAGLSVSLTSLALLASFYVASVMVIRGGNDPLAIGERYLGSASLSLEMLREWTYTPVLVLLPCFMSGIAYPASVSLYAQASGSVSSAVGTIGLINGLGAATGALLTAFGLVTWLGIQGVASAMSLLLALVVATLLPRVPAVHGRRWFAYLPALVVLACIALTPHDLPRRMLLSVIGNRHQRFLHYEEARTATVSVIRNSINGERQLLVNAVNEVTTRLVHDQSFKLLGQLGPLLHHNPKRGVMICLGAGLAAGSALTHPLEQLDVVDLLAAVRRGAALFPEENNHVLRDPRLKLHIDDGRQYLLTTRDRYDVAIVDSTHPKSVDSWILYTRQFFELLRSRLNEGGIVVQWLPLHGLSDHEFRSVVATFAAVFPQMTLWASVGYETYGQVGYAKLVGQRSSKSMQFDTSRMALRLQMPNVQNDLARYGMGRLPEVLDQFVAGPERIAQWTQDCPLHDDDRPFLGYLTDLSQGPAMTPERLLAVREWPEKHLRLPEAGRAALEAELRRTFDAQGLVLSGQLQAGLAYHPQGGKIQRYQAQTATSLAYYQALAERYPDDPARQFEAGTQLLSLGQVDAAAAVFENSLERFPGSLRLRINQGLLWLEMGQPKRAAQRFSTMLLQNPGAAILNLNLGVALLAQGEAAAARERLLFAYRAEPSSFGAVLSLVDAELASSQFRSALTRLKALPSGQQRDERVLSRLATASDQLGNYDQAHAYWAQAMQANPYRENYTIEWARRATPTQFRDAISRLRIMRNLHPTTPAVLVALGQAYARVLQWDDASQVYVDALELDSHNSEAALGLGESLARLGRVPEAIDALCVARRLGADAAIVHSALQKLAGTVQACAQGDGRSADARSASN